MLATARNDNSLGVCIDAVLNQLGYGFEGIALRERDNADRVPIVADSQFAPLCSLGLHAPHLRPELPEMNHPLYRKPSFLRRFHRLAGLPALCNVSMGFLFHTAM